MPAWAHFDHDPVEMRSSIADGRQLDQQKNEAKRIVKTLNSSSPSRMTIEAGSSSFKYAPHHACMRRRVMGNGLPPQPPAMLVVNTRAHPDGCVVYRRMSAAPGCASQTSAARSFLLDGPALGRRLLLVERSN